jgi:putative Mg2+ transporter-C (MgtC) family protein
MESFLSPSTIGHDVILVRLAVALLLGAVIGLDREIRQRPAGIRTHMLVSMSSALFVVLTLEIIAQTRQLNEASGDPVRVIEAVTAGVAFLAAGAIIRAGNSVEGVTTAAGLWLSGAAGLACGLGLWTIAAIAVGLGFIVVTLLGMVTRHIGSDAKKANGDQPH